MKEHIYLTRVCVSDMKDLYTWCTIIIGKVYIHRIVCKLINYYNLKNKFIILVQLEKFIKFVGRICTLTIYGGSPL